MSWNFERVAGPYEFTEGPVWDGGGIRFTDIPSSRILRYDRESGETTVVREGTDCANGLKFGPDGRLYGCEMRGQRVSRYEPDGSRTVIADAYDGKRLNSPNDLAFDGTGRLWFTDPDIPVDWLDESDRTVELDHTSVYRADPPATDQGEGGWPLTRVTEDTTQPNGILVSPDDRTLYVAESNTGTPGQIELRGYEIREDGSLGPYRVLHNFSPHRGIDGMCLDAEGNIVATAGYHEGGPGPLLYVFAPSGRILATHESPDPRPTNCCFGDEDLRALYVTGYDGCLYRARTDRQGYLGAP